MAKFITLEQAFKNGAYGCIYFFTAAYWRRYWMETLISVGIVGIVYTCCRIGGRRTKYQYAQVIPALQALLTVPLAFTFLTSMFSQYILLGDAGLTIFFFQTTPIAGFLTVNLMMMSLLHIIIGLFDHLSYLHYLWTWIHHLFYFCIASNALYNGFGNGFAALLSEDFPTIVLTLGAIYPKFYSQGTYGLSAFALRIVIHTTVALLSCIAFYQFSYIWITGLATSVLNFIVFGMWYSTSSFALSAEDAPAPNYSMNNLDPSPGEAKRIETGEMSPSRGVILPQSENP